MKYQYGKVAIWKYLEAFPSSKSCKVPLKGPSVWSKNNLKQLNYFHTKQMFGFQITSNNVNVAQTSVNKMRDSRPLENKTNLKWKFIPSKNFLKFK